MTTTAELVTRVTPLGLRFVDDVTGLPVADGLDVTYPGPAGGARRLAIRTPASVFAVYGVAGLRASEHGAGDAAFWSAPPVTATIRIQVGDSAGRYASCSFAVTVPHRGVFDLACAAKPPGPPPAAPRPSVPLLSSPARVPPRGMAAIRAQLRDAATGGPASFAVLEVDTGPGSAVARGLADADGRVLAVLAYPPPPGPLGGGPLALTAAAWTLRVRVRYAPGAAAGPYPDLCDALGQPLASQLPSPSPAVPMTTWQLVYGQDAVLRSIGESTLLVHP